MSPLGGQPHIVSNPFLHGLMQLRSPLSLECGHIDRDLLEPFRNPSSHPIRNRQPILHMAAARITEQGALTRAGIDP